MTDKEKLDFVKSMTASISRPRYYALQFKLLMYSWGKEVEISTEEWKKAEELGWVEKE